jgi:hypothetical protein
MYSLPKCNPNAIIFLRISPDGVFQNHACFRQPLATFYNFGMWLRIAAPAALLIFGSLVSARTVERDGINYVHY